MGLRGKAPSWGLRPHTPKRLIFDWEGSMKSYLPLIKLSKFSQPSEMVGIVVIWNGELFKGDRQSLINRNIRANRNIRELAVGIGM